MADSIAPVVRLVAQRGAELRPELARELWGAVVLRFDEGYPPVRIEFRGGELSVADGDGAADVEIAGRLPDVIALIDAPLRGGVPDPLTGSGRAVLGAVARGNVQVNGSKALGRQVLRLLSLS